jgi:hypothetical protein
MAKKNGNLAESVREFETARSAQAPAFEKGGENTEFAVQGNYLYIRVDLTKNQGKSASGKTIIINKPNSGYCINAKGMSIALNCNLYRKPLANE